LKKDKFNDKYDITIKGSEAELYIQDVKESLHSNGIYSVLNSDWIKKPEKLDNIVQYDNSDLVYKWTNLIDNACENGTEDDLKQIKAT